MKAEEVRKGKMRLHFKDWEDNIFSTASILETLFYEIVEFSVSEIVRRKGMKTLGVSVEVTA